MPHVLPLVPSARPGLPSTGAFTGMFKPNAEKQAEIDRAYAAQLEVAEQRRNPEARRRALRETEARRARESAAFEDKFAWQRSKDPLAEFKKRQAAGKVKKIGYEDEPKGGIPMPMASFGVGGEFGQGGKYDNGERFDLRLPFVDQGWVDEADLPQGKKGGKEPGGDKSGRGQSGDPFEWWNNLWKK